MLAACQFRVYLLNLYVLYYMDGERRHGTVKHGKAKVKMLVPTHEMGDGSYPPRDGDAHDERTPARFGRDLAELGPAVQHTNETRFFVFLRDS